jgi:hypothetical protein
MVGKRVIEMARKAGSCNSMGANIGSEQKLWLAVDRREIVSASQSFSEEATTPGSMRGWRRDVSEESWLA